MSAQSAHLIFGARGGALIRKRHKMNKINLPILLLVTMLSILSYSASVTLYYTVQFIFFVNLFTMFNSVLYHTIYFCASITSFTLFTSVLKLPYTVLHSDPKWLAQYILHQKEDKLLF